MHNKATHVSLLSGFSFVKKMWVFIFRQAVYNKIDILIIAVNLCCF